MSDLLMQILQAVIIVIVPIIGAFFVDVLKSYKLSNDVISNNIITNALFDDIIDIVIQVVKSTSQTYVDSLKKDGVFTLEEQVEAFNITKQEVLDLLSEEMKEFIVDKYGNLDLWLETKIEQIVKETK